MDLGLKGRSALVTAASKGLGRACAEALIGEGAEVFISSRDPVSIESTATQISAAGWLASDVSQPGEPEALVEAAMKRLSGLDMLVINAGGPPPGTFQSTRLEMWDVAFQLTLMSAVRLIRAGLPHLKRSDLARELAPDHITVNCLAPDAILTDRTRALAVAAGVDPEERINQQSAAAPMGRMGDPAEFGAACAFLCSKQAGYITGQTLGVDGGALLGVH